MTPIQLDPNHSKNTLADTTPEQARANTRFAQQSEVDQRNAARVQEYETQYAAYAAARDARPDATNLIVPSPARTEAVFTDSRGWPYIDEANTPVIAPHTYVAPVKTQGGFFTAGASQTTGPNGISAGELLAAKLYGEPLTFGGMKFLRVA